jgi:uncharacterized protein YPO0396
MMTETDTAFRVKALEEEVRYAGKALTQLEDKTLAQLEARLDARLDRIEQRIEAVKESVSFVHDRIDRLLHWAMVFILVSGFAGTGLVLAIGLRQL